MEPGLPDGVDASEILGSVGHAVIVTDVAGRILYWNAAAEKLYGWASGEVVGRPVDEVTVPDGSRPPSADVRTALAEGNPWSGSFTVRNKDGTTFPALVTDTGVYRGGELVAVIGVSTNLGRAIEPLLERSTDAAVVVRADAVITYASPAVKDLFGWTGSLAGTSIVPLLHPDERDALATFLEGVVGNPGAHPALELRLLSGTGWIWAEAAITNLLDDPGVRGLVCSLRRSRRREAHDTAARQVEQLSEALTSRVLIEQAKGFLAGRDGITTEVAFERLRRHARSNHLGLHEVAQRVLDGNHLLGAED